MNKNYSKENFIKGAPKIDDPNEVVNGFPTGYMHVWMQPSLYDKYEVEAYVLWDCIHVAKNIKPIPNCK